MRCRNQYIHKYSIALLGAMLYFYTTIQAQPATFNKLFDFNNWWEGSHTSIPNSQGYLSIGTTWNVHGSDSTGYSRLLLLQTDFKGNLLWQKVLLGIDSVNLGLGETDYAFRLSDGHYITSGYMIDFRDSVQVTSAYLLKFDSTGQVRWLKTYNERGYAGTTHLTVLSDGGFAFCGQSALNRQWDGLDIFLARTDSLGNLLWWEEYGSAGRDFSTRVISTPDQGLVVCGSMVLPGSGQRITTLIKTNAQGQQQWKKHYAVSPYDHWGFACKPADTGYWLLANTYTTPEQTHQSLTGVAIRLNSAFDSVWSFQQPHPEGLGFLDMVSMNNGDVVALGVIGTTGENAAWLGRISAQGALLWQRQYVSRESSLDYLKHIVATPDHGLLLTGKANHPDPTSPKQEDLWMVKTDTFGCVQPGCHLTDSRGDDPQLNRQAWLKAAPNPFSEQTTISYDLPSNTIGTFTIELREVSSGKLLQTYPLHIHKGTIILHRNQLKPGLLAVMLKNKGQLLAVSKLILLSR